MQPRELPVCQSGQIARCKVISAGELVLVWMLMAITTITARGQVSQVTGTVTDPAGRPVANASVEILKSGESNPEQALSDAVGRFSFHAGGPGTYTLEASALGLKAAPQKITIIAGRHVQVSLALTMAQSETISVKATMAATDLLAPDPAEKVFVQQDLIDANPGRPGAPVSVPGYPVETASGGIKAPQYFAPGVAGDHGEPIAEYIALGGYLVPNNLSANAHGNGYADPNLLIAPMLAYAQVDGGSFNVLEGNHVVNEALTYGLRSTADRFVALTGDRQDVDVVAVPEGGANVWLAVEAAYGNGFLRRLEHRQQYKMNGEWLANLGAHRISILGIGYYGTSYVPGLVPIGALNTSNSTYANWGDTVDPRQREQTHTTLLAASDTWSHGNSQQMQFSGFFRTYNLSLYSDFGQGLIRQSEFRTVAGGSTEYVKDVLDRISFLTGVDVQHEAPRDDDLNRYGFYTAGEMSDGQSTKVDSANVTITPVAPYAALQGRLGKFVHAYAGWRRDEIDFNNQDLLNPANSFHQWIGVNSPKATVSLLGGSAKWAPVVAVSAGESFFTEDPRIGTGTARGTPVSRDHAYQLAAVEPLGRTEIRLTLGQTTIGEQLAKIDPDTDCRRTRGRAACDF